MFGVQLGKDMTFRNNCPENIKNDFYHASVSPIRRGFAPGFVNYKKGALDSQPQVIKFTSSLPMVGGSFQILRLLPPLLVAMI
jgi:hypothetical protein